MPPRKVKKRPQQHPPPDPLAGLANGADGAPISVPQFLEVLIRHRAACEKDGKYLEAMIADKRIHELREHEENRRREAILSQQTAERLAIEETQMLEHESFLAMWDAQMEQFEVHVQETEDALKQRHRDDMENFRRTADSVPLRPRWSATLMSLRRSEQSLVKQRHYPQAQEAKIKADALEAAEREKCQQQRDAAVSLKEKQLRSEQRQEATAVKARLQRQREERLRTRKEEEERLVRRFKNLKMDLETQQSTRRTTDMRFVHVQGETVARLTGGGKSRRGKELLCRSERWE